MLKFGRVADVDPAKGVARVYLDAEGIVTNWLPVSVVGTSDAIVKVGFPLSINEHVWCIMDDACEYGVIGGAIYSSKVAPPAGSAAGIVFKLANGSQITYDINSGSLDIVCAGDIRIKGRSVSVESETNVAINALQEVKIDVPITLINELLRIGSVEAAEDVKVGTVSFKLHKHISAAAGSPTGPPI